MARKQRKRLRLEELEPRILFSADLPMAVPLSFDGESHSYVDSLQDRATTTTEAASVASYEIVFVDLNTPDFDRLVEDIFRNAEDSGRRIELILLDSDQDGLQQITDVLAARENVDALHIVSHGTDAEFMVGGSVADYGELLRNAELLSSWGDALSPTADLLIYGCDLASGAEGQHLISTLATLTGADVAASDDITGHASLGGDWELEYRVGSVETAEISSQLASDEWMATLAVGASNLNAGELYTEDTTLQLTPIVVTGSASGAVTVTLTLSDAGAGALSTGTSGSVTSTYSNGVWTATGAESDVNTLLALVDFIPSSDYDNDFSIAVSVDDGVDLPLAGIKPMTATPVNDDPIASDDNYSLNEDSSITATLGLDDLLMNDSDAEGDLLNVNTTPVSGPANGTLLLNADGTFTYTPNADFNGTDSFVYSVSDGNGGTAQATVTLTVNPVNDAPVLDPSALFSLDSMSSFLPLDSGNSASDIIASAPGAITDVDTGGRHGIAVTGVDESNGTWEYSGNNGNTWSPVGNVSEDSALLINGAAKKLRFVPDTGFTGTATITFRAWDATDGLGNGTNDADVTNNGGTTAYSADIGTASINIVGATMFIATEDDVTNSGHQNLKDWSAGSILGFSVLDIEPGTSNGVPTSFTDLDAFATDSDVQITALHSVSTSISIGSSQTINLQEGDFLFVAADAETLTSTNSLSFNAGDVIAFRPDAAGDYSSGTFIHLLDNVGSGTTTGISLVEQSTVVGDTTLLQGTFVFTQTGGNGVYHFSADAVGAGTTTGTTSMLIDFADISPTFSDDLAGVHLVLSPLELADSTLPAGTLIFTTAATSDVQLGNNDVDVSPDDVVYLVANTTSMGATGTSTADAIVLFEGKDAKLNKTAEYIRAITFHRDNEITAGNDSYTLNEDSPFTATLGLDDLLLNDSDVDGDPLTVNTTPISGPASGTLVLNADGTFTYTPNANFNGTDSFIYSVSDGNGGTAQATVTLTINPVNDLPVAGDDSYALNEDTPFTATVGLNDLLLNDSDLDGDALTVNTTPVSGPANGTLVLNADGTFTYTPNANFHGSDSFVYSVSDGNGGTAQATVTLTINPVNDLPVAGDDSYTLNEDTPFTATLGLDDLLLNDSDVDGDLLTVNTTPISGPANGTLVLNADGTFTYTPNANFHGTDSFVYSVSDGNGGTAQATVTLTINPVNDLPVAGDDSYALNEDTPFTATVGLNDLLLNDSDLDGDTLTVNTTPVSGPANGTLVLNADGTFTYTPNANFHGSDSFVYSVSDGNGGTAQATVTLTINPVNDLPVAGDDSYALNEDTPFTATVGLNDLLLNDSDLDGDALTVNTTPVSGPANGILVLDADGTFTYTPNANFHGTDSFVYSVSDGNGGTAQATVTMTINSINDLPQISSHGGAASADVTTTENNSLVTQITATDVDGNTITFNIAGGSDQAAFSINPSTGSLQFNLPPNYESPTDVDADNVYEVVVSATDPAGGTAQQALRVTVADVNEAPVVDDQSLLVQQPLDEGDIVGAVSAADEDALDTLFYEITGGTGLPQFEIDSASGVIRASDAINLAETAQTLTLQVQVTDSAGASTSATVRIGVDQIGADPQQTVLPVNDDTTSGSEATPESVSAVATTTEEPDPTTSELDDPGAEEPPLLAESSYPAGGGHTDDGDNISFDVAPTEPHTGADSLGGNSSQERGYRAVLEILFDGQEGSDEITDLNSNTFSLDRLRFDVNLGRVGSELFEELTFDTSKLTADISESEALAFQAAAATGLSLSVGFVAWALRTGALMAGLFAARPLWQGFDPMPVLKKADDETGTPDSIDRPADHSSRPLIGERFDR